MRVRSYRPKHGNERWHALALHTGGSFCFYNVIELVGSQLLDLTVYITSNTRTNPVEQCLFEIVDISRISNGNNGP